MGHLQAAHSAIGTTETRGEAGLPPYSVSPACPLKSSGLRAAAMSTWPCAIPIFRDIKDRSHCLVSCRLLIHALRSQGPKLLACGRAGSQCPQHRIKSCVSPSPARGRVWSSKPHLCLWMFCRGQTTSGSLFCKQHF